MTPNGDERWPASLYGRGTDPDPRFSLANERTFLAWIRTGIALIALAAAFDTLGRTMGVGGAGRYAAGSAVLGIACCVEAFRRWYTAERRLRAERALGGGRAMAVLVGCLAVLGVIVLVGLSPR